MIGFICLGLVAAYVSGSALRLKPLTIGRLQIEYPHLGIALRQLLASSTELLGCAGIIYFALPQQDNPGYLAILGIFIASFSVALASESPGGLGVFELLFIKAMPAVPHDKVLTALLVFRLLYLVLPLVFATFVVIFFERTRLEQALHAHPAAGHPEPGAEIEHRETGHRKENAPKVAELPASPANS